jgi:lipid II:glycine glycyltransferase (peptidoglycan interpeptide bridge formation enzyme)
LYEILKKNYKERVKLPLPPIDFFLKYFHTQAIKIFAVIHNEKIIGGAFCPVLENKKLFTFYYCGIREYHKKIFPTHLAILASLEYCIVHQIPHFNFMGAGKPEVDYGVRNYKLEFGGELVEYGRFLKINNHFLYNLGKLGLKLSRIFGK